MSHGNANRVAIEVLKPVEAPTGDAQIDAIYSGRNAGVRALHDRVVETVLAFGPDVELAPKKTYVSLRRAKQFGMVGPGTGGRLEVCLNLPDAPIAGSCGNELTKRRPLMEGRKPGTRTLVAIGGLL